MAYTTFWPGDARLAITISMMFEANGQPISGAGGPIAAFMDTLIEHIHSVDFEMQTSLA
jgi:hypothetical protein